MTIREEPFKNCRSRLSAKWKIKEDKIEEAKKQKTKGSNDEWNYAKWQPSSQSWQQPTTWTSSSSSAWREWNSDQKKRVSVLIGNHQTIAVAQTKRVSVLDRDRRVPGSLRSHGSEE